MTEQAKAMVEQLTTFENKKRTPLLEKNEVLLRKSDVIELVEKLTAWVKVEDGLPEFKGKPFYILAESVEDILLVLIEEYEDLDNVRGYFSNWRYIY